MKNRKIKAQFMKGVQNGIGYCQVYPDQSVLGIVKVHYDMAMPNRLNWLPEYDWVMTDLQWHDRAFCIWFKLGQGQTPENEMHVAMAILRTPPSRN